MSCNFLEDAANNAGLTGNTTLDLPISYNLSSVSRTLATDYGITVSSVTVTVENDLFSYGPDVLIFDAYTDIASGTIQDIVEGTYTVTLSAYMLDNDSNPVLVAEGIQTDIAIVSDQVTSVNISMSIVVGLGDLVVSGEIISTDIPRDGLVVEYLFDGVATDTSGNGYDASINGATTTTDRNGDVNSAYSFDGVDDYLDLPENIIDESNSFTVSFWINKVGETGSCHILNRFFNSGGYDNRWIFYLNDTEIVFQIGEFTSGTINRNYVSQNIVTDSWFMVTFTYNINGQISMFINGENPITQTLTTDEVAKFQASSSDLLFGKATGFDASYVGSLDDFYIYNRVLSAEEINALYTN